MKKVTIVFGSLLFLFAVFSLDSFLNSGEAEIPSVVTVRLEYEEVVSSALSLSANSKIVGDEVYYTGLYGTIHIGDVYSLWNDLLYLEKFTEIRKMTLFMFSSGGGSFDGIALSDQLEAAQKRGFYFTAYGTGIIASAILPVFAVCDLGIATRGTQFLIHEAALLREGEKIKDKASEIKAQSKVMELIKAEYLRKLTENSNLSEEKWDRMLKDSTWFNANEAKKYGLLDIIDG